MKVILLFTLISQFAWSQDCADCAQKSLPIPLENTVKENLAITKKLDPEIEDVEICEAFNTCKFYANYWGSIDSFEKQIQGFGEKKDHAKKVISILDESLKDKKLDTAGLQLMKQKYVDDIQEYDEGIQESLRDLKEVGSYFVKNQNCYEYNNTKKNPTLENGSCDLSEKERAVLQYLQSYNCQYRASKEKAIKNLYSELEKTLSKLPSYEGFSKIISSQGLLNISKSPVGSIVPFSSYVSLTTTNSSSSVYYLYSKSGKIIPGQGSNTIFLGPNSKLKLLEDIREPSSLMSRYVLREVSEKETPEESKKLDEEILAMAKKEIYTYAEKPTYTATDNYFSCPKNAGDKIPMTFKPKDQPHFYYKSK